MRSGTGARPALALRYLPALPIAKRTLHAPDLQHSRSLHVAGRDLVLMAYLQRIVNAGGTVEREFAVGTGAVDLWVTYGGREDVIELKIQRAKYTLDDGLEQVTRYAKRIGRDVGYLVIFDPKSELPWEERGRVESCVVGGGHSGRGAGIGRRRGVGFVCGAVQPLLGMAEPERVTFVSRAA